jgi:hypothetical protein
MRTAHRCVKFSGTLYKFDDCEQSSRRNSQNFFIFLLFTVFFRQANRPKDGLVQVLCLIPGEKFCGMHPFDLKTGLSFLQRNQIGLSNPNFSLRTVRAGLDYS